LLVSFAFRFEVEAVGGIRFIPSPFAIGALHEGLNISFREIVGFGSTEPSPTPAPRGKPTNFAP
jgi:hypothetical protein